MQNTLIEFKKGDNVYHKIHGNGIVKTVYNNDLYKVMVQFDNGNYFSFTETGKFNIMDKEPTLFLKN